MWYLPLLRAGLMPDALLRFGIRRLLADRIRQESGTSEEDALRRKMQFIAAMREGPLAIHTRDANEQHYEVPTAYFQRVLGHRLKYSSCLWPPEVRDLDGAELAMLDLTTGRAGIQDGMDVLELGCGWGSLSLYLAARFPGCRITSVSNSRTQKAYIDAEAAREGLTNLRIITSDMNDFDISERFDRVVSVEMFEHMRNYRELLKRVAGWLKPDGRVFVHIFVHDRFAYPFATGEDDDWMARYFFTGGLMPSFDVFDHFTEDLAVEQRWEVNGQHYEKTLNTWLIRMDTARAELTPLFRETYGKEWKTWWQYWRIFYMACAELFGYRHGKEWYVGHYLLKPVA
ncbi:MAG TPA: cyclopropane-fatty-acyl-phospholipid synthase family protein [Kiritimatiellia bacterium]|nr:cyclopropane-fatty-acyl-phospholipid synthase family protein [Kiritimatiellia bacterium]HMO97891.1 cyclopropane-fatty-acyl-phospholipid synthase family protein [Kiritimatiellia bacterium]HMP95589.1 cyclopropane-fatty-acyl-phospholipid synthase family protein [Kiritimatiellia bacterium]